MTATTEIRSQIEQSLDRLSPEALQFVANFIAYLADKESEEATQELLKIPGFLEAFERGKKDREEGRVVEWRSVRSDV